MTTKIAADILSALSANMFEVMYNHSVLKHSKIQKHQEIETNGPITAGPRNSCSLRYSEGMSGLVHRV